MMLFMGNGDVFEDSGLPSVMIWSSSMPVRDSVSVSLVPMDDLWLCSFGSELFPSQQPASSP